MQICGTPCAMKAQAKNPQLNVLIELTKKLAADYRRSLGEIARLQVNPAQAHTYMADFISRQHEFATAYFAKGKYPVYFDDADTTQREKDATPLPADEKFWLMKTIGGEANFRHGREPLCFHVAFIDNGKAMCGIVYEPLTDTLYQAEYNAGASATGIGRMRAGGRTELTDTMALLPQKSEDVVESNILAPLANAGAHTRKNGNNMLDIVHVAAGKADICLLTRLTPLETLLGTLFLTESGTSFSTWQGKPFNIATQRLLAANSKLHGKVLKQLR